MSTGTPKPCPFCGSAKVSKVLPLEERHIVRMAVVRCRNPKCQAFGPSRDTVEEAVEAWNERQS